MKSFLAPVIDEKMYRKEMTRPRTQRELEEKLEIEFLSSISIQFY